MLRTQVSTLSKLSVRSSRFYVHETRKNLNITATNTASKKYAKRAPLRRIIKTNALENDVKLREKDLDELAKYYVNSQKKVAQSKLKDLGIEKSEKKSTI
jgi:hypothetical protein